MSGYSEWPPLSAAIQNLAYNASLQRFSYYTAGYTISLLKLTSDLSANISLLGNATNSSGQLLTASSSAGTNLTATQFYDVPNTNAVDIISTRSGTAAAAVQNNIGDLYRIDLAGAPSLPAGYVAATGLPTTPSNRIGPYKLFFMNTGAQIYTSRIIGAPNPVSAITVTGALDALSVSWTAPTTNNAPITGYVVRAVDNTGAVAASTTVSGSSTSCTLSGLMSEMQYNVYVVACSDLGYSFDSVAQQGTPISLPGTPTITHVFLGDGTAQLRWSHAPDGGSPLTAYELSVVNMGFSVTVAGSAVTHTLTGLPNNSPHNIRIRAMTAAGYGPPLFYEVPAPVPVINRDSQLVAAIAARLGGGSALAFREAIQLQRTTYIPYVTDLVENVDASAFYAATKPGVSLANRRVRFVVAADGETVGVDTSSLTSADVLHIPGDAGESVTLNISGSLYGLSFDASGRLIYAGITYDVGSTVTLDRPYAVVGRGSAGLTPVDVPDAPTGVTATAGDAQVTVSWSAPANDGGSAITAYTVTNVTTGMSYGVSGSTTSTTITGLTNGTTYTFTVSATNAAGSSAASDPVTATPVAPVPPAPEGGDAVVPCFFGNARVLTPHGYRRMDSLVAGDSVVTPEGSTAAIERVKVTQCAAGSATNPYVIPAGTFGATRRLLISPDHKVCLTDGRRVEAKRLGLAQEDREGTLTYYNLELAGQADMIVSGVAVESLAPVRRVVVRFADFVAAMRARYGELTPATLAAVQRTCRFVGPNVVEVPMVRRR